MERVKIIDIKKSATDHNDRQADILREELRAKGTFLLNLMSSPGSGKTTTVLRTIEALKEDFRIGVMEADIDSTVDAERVLAAGVPAVQLHTGGMCHLEAGMTRDGLAGLDTDSLDLIILENVGNLVCPAEFDTGASKNAMILSVPEGDDKPLKYPLMFSTCDALIINKIDVAQHFDFDLSAVRERVHKLNPNIAVFEISAKTGQGIAAWAGWLQSQIITSLKVPKPLSPEKEVN